MRSRLIDRVAAPGAISAVFQPIFALGSEPFQVVAAEGLARGPKGSTLETPDVLFEFARRKHEESLVDRAAIAAILGAAGEIPVAWQIHLNVHASTLAHDEQFPEFVLRTAQSSNIGPSRIVLEALEYANNAFDESMYLRGVAEARARGLEIALDDVGAGVSNLHMIVLSNPKLLKVDRSLVQGIAEDGRRRATLRAIRLIAEDFGAAIVVEGVDSQPDLRCAIDLGVEFAQGFLLARPMSAANVAALASRASASNPLGAFRALELVAALAS